ncbi:Undecaprenyl-phosphate 4-deoxy-4-formamido-L-arabinose transferase [subsurface metagenome]
MKKGAKILTAINSRRNISSLAKTRQSDKSDNNNNFQGLLKYLEKYKNNQNPILLSIILPVFNEEKTIKKILKNLPKYESIEIIIVDDHSTDNSLEEIKQVKDSSNMHIIEHKVNRGYGAALTTGIQYSKGEVFITIDSDGQHRPKDFFNLIKPIFDGEADITIGSRYKGSYNYELPLATRLGEAILEVGIRIFFAQKVKNNQGGFRAFHRRTYKMFEETQFHGYAFTTELILSAVLHDYKIKECPIHLLGREHGASYIVLNKLLISLMLCIGLYAIKNIKRLISRR